MNYLDAREAWLDQQCHPDSTVARGLLKRGADWGREYETLANVDKVCNRLDLESPAICRAIKALRIYAKLREDPYLHRLKNAIFNRDLGTLARAVLKVYDAERAKGAE